jgi:hypothetical protein
MPQGTSRIRSIAEIELDERLTLVGFLLSYSALMAIVVSSASPFLSENWSSLWPITLAIGCVAALFIVAGLLVRPKASTRF